jgi:hypothetical protein
MFTVKYKEITSPHFNVAFQNLSVQALPVKVAYNIKKMADKLHEVRKQIALDYQKEIVEIFAKKNPDGTLAHPKDKDGNELKDQFEPDETQKEAMAKAVDNFGEKTVSIDRQKLILEDLGAVQLSAAELSAVEPLFTTREEMLESATATGTGAEKAS